ncbi:MAG: sulfotransferase [Sphingomonadales bacterium]
METFDRELDRGWDLHRAGHLAEAEKIYRAVLRARPDHPGALQMLGQVAFATGHVDASIELIRRSLSEDPKQAMVWVNLGIALRQSRKDGEAAAFERALEIDPSLVQAALQLATTLLTEGRNSEAEDCLRKALARQPNCGEAYRMLSLATNLTPDDPVVETMEQLDARPDLSAGDRLHLHFALGKVYERQGNTEKFMDHVLEANRLQRSQVTRPVSYYETLFGRIREIFHQDIGGPSSEALAGSPTPIFIVGMPRSGTTLVEQILASHPEVFGGDEITFFHEDVVNAAQGFTGRAFPGGIPSLTNDAVRALGRLYLDKLGALSPGSPYVTDKYVANFQHIGLIRRLLPTARVIHVSRAPMDTCFSILKNYFPGDEAYHCGLEDMGAFYRLYHDLMDHWRAVFPDFVYSLKYEDLIAEQETETRKLLDFCGLSWHPACLEFHNTVRPVRTNSWTQVRKPIYRTSRGNWRPFQRQLQPLIKALGDLAPLVDQ